MPKTPLDLSQLALARAPSSEDAKRPSLLRKSGGFSRYALPLSILVGFLALLVSAAGNQLLPAQTVTVLPVIVQASRISAGWSTAFPSTGWIEPRPNGVRVLQR